MSVFWGHIESIVNGPKIPPSLIVAMRDPLVKAGQGSQAADLTISGHLLALSVDAKSRVGSTNIITESKIVIHALNYKDGSIVRMTLNGARSDSVFWFEPEDAQRLVNDVLNDSFARLLQSTEAESKVLRLSEQAE